MFYSIYIILIILQHFCNRIIIGLILYDNNMYLYINLQITKIDNMYTLKLNFMT